MVLEFNYYGATGGLGNVRWLLGPEYPAEGLSEVKGDMVLLLRLLASGSPGLGALCPLRGVTLKGKKRGRRAHFLSLRSFVWSAPECILHDAWY